MTTKELGSTSLGGSYRLWKALMGGGGDQHSNVSWRDEALCAQDDNPDKWFMSGDGGNDAPAKKVCQNCPVQEECLAYAVKHGERFGVWGGANKKERDGLTIDSRGKVVKKLEPPTRYDRRLGYEIIKQLGGYQQDLTAEQVTFATAALGALYVSARNAHVMRCGQGRDACSEDAVQDAFEKYYLGKELPLPDRDFVYRFFKSYGKKVEHRSRLEILQEAVGKNTLREVIRETLSSVGCGEPPRIGE